MVATVGAGDLPLPPRHRTGALGLFGRPQDAGSCMGVLAPPPKPPVAKASVIDGLACSSRSVPPREPRNREALSDALSRLRPNISMSVHVNEDEVDVATRVAVIRSPRKLWTPRTQKTHGDGFREMDGVCTAHAARDTLQSARPQPPENRRLAAEALARQERAPETLAHNDNYGVDTFRDRPLVAAAGDRVCRVRHVGLEADHDPEEGRLAAAPQDGEWEVRVAAGRGLGRCASPANAAVDATGRTDGVATNLAMALQDRSLAVRRSAERALHALGPAAAESLAKALAGDERDCRPRVREASALALGVLGPVASTPHSAELAQAALQDGTRAVRHAATEVLDSLGNRAPAHVNDLVMRWRKVSRTCKSLHKRRLDAWDMAPPVDAEMQPAPTSCGPGGRHLAGTCQYPVERCSCRRQPLQRAYC
eukprot:TRINITY_DN33983_c0_g1_i1.p1 TRINITY_DN33983_c0_g1~~TRINITY_DN33983_c0_g1_i1.p1  ORF type:complete len:424 (+),score=70.82 TRINITY_DN33983_c0_g1_i1:152-1423(+)